MSYLIDPIRIPIDKEIEQALYQEGVEVRSISISPFAEKVKTRKVAFRLRYNIIDRIQNVLGLSSINGNFQKLMERFERACDKLEKRYPEKYKGLFETLLQSPMQYGYLKEYKDRNLAEKLV